MVAEDVEGTVVESGFDSTKHGPKQPSKYVVKPLSDTKSKIEQILADLDVRTRTNVEVIIGT